MDHAELRSALRGVIKPELRVNIIDLGLVYRITADGNTILVEMTMRVPFRPLGPYLIDAVKTALARSFPHTEACVELVWEPLWTPSRITAKGRRKPGWDESDARVA